MKNSSEVHPSLILKYFSLFILIFFSRFLYGQLNYPAYEEVVLHFFSNYDVSEPGNHAYLRFVKDKAGYSVEEYDFDLKSYRNRQLFWSSDKKKYVKPEFPKSSSPDTESIKYFMNDWNSDKYDLYPFYGYEAWEQDVIQYFDKKELNSDEIYALGRAYSHAAGNLLNNNSGFADKSKMFQLAEQGTNLMTPKQLKQYRYYTHKSCEMFGMLCERDQDYKTIVGSICTKYHNQFMTAFLDLLTLQNEEEAMKEISEPLYNDFFHDMAKNYLGSCDSNAILFTNGDNDTYPLLYLQAAEGYRQDVMVINRNLLNVNNYINRLREEKIFEADSLSMILSRTSYSGEKMPLGYVARGLYDEAVSVDVVMRELNRQSRLLAENPVYNEQYQLPDKMVIIPDSSRVIPLQLKDKRYLIKGEIVLLDIIQSNIAERPVYFLEGRRTGFKDHLQLQGFAFKLTDVTEAAADNFLYGGIDPQKTRHMIMEDFCFHPDRLINNSAAKVVLAGYQYAFSYLARYYTDHGQNDSCRLVIDRYLELFPNTVHTMDFMALPLLAAAYDAGLKERGDEIAYTILGNLNEKINSGTTLSDNDIQIMQYTLKNLEHLVSENEQLKSEMDNLQIQLNNQ